eukprot:m.270935 g.270935  ORF g.270935 m.270935 type:complete len:77 (-) comp26862_c5_seq6:616-846(-)
MAWVCKASNPAPCRQCCDVLHDAVVGRVSLVVWMHSSVGVIVGSSTEPMAPRYEPLTLVMRPHIWQNSTKARTFDV